MTPSGAYRHAHVAQGSFFHPKDAMRHNRDTSRAWTTFFLDKSEGFSQAGVERLNDSIRTYVWAILGAQVQTRSNILKTGTDSLAIKNTAVCIHTPGPRVWDWALSWGTTTRSR